MNRIVLRRWQAATVVFALVAAQLFAPPPTWWAERGVLTSNATANDYAAVNLGQLKRIATLARDEMEAKLPGGAGTTINTLVNSWALPPPTGVIRNDYAAVNVGQLKTLARLYYDRLAQFSYTGQPLTTGQIYPWTTTVADDNDYAATNIGQVKYLFSFDLTSILPDSDADGLPDIWEVQHFGNLSQTASGDADGDGRTNLQEYQAGTNPTAVDSDGDGVSDGAENTNGTNPLVADPIAPAQISGLRLHLRADAGITLDGDGLVSVWNDQSGLGNHATPPAAERRPLLVATALNSLPVVRFDGSNDYFNLPNFMSGASVGEVVVVLKATSATPSGHYGLWRMGSGDTFYPRNDGTIQESFGSGSPYEGPRPPTTLSNYHLYQVVALGGEWVSRTNGLDVMRRYANSTAFHSSPALGISSSSYFSGDIAELVVFDRALTAAERDGLGRYLNQRYALVAAAPSAPATLLGTPLSASQISLSWQAPLPTVEVAYDIERKAGAGAYAIVATVRNATSHIDTTTSAGQEYTYRVRARSMAGTSAYSEVQASTAPNFISVDMPLSAVRAWLKADAVQSADLVASWFDHSAAHADALQSATVRQPSVISGALNGKPVVRYDGSNDYQSMPLFMAGATQGEVFVVLKAAASPPSHNFGLWNFGASGYYPQISGTIQETFGSTATYVGGVPSLPLTQYHLYNVSAQSNLWTSRHNGKTYQQSTTNTVGFLPGVDSVINIGGRGAVGDYFQGDIAEMIFFDRVLTEAERDTVAFYLHRKYALTSTALFTGPRDMNRDGIVDAVGAEFGFNGLSNDVDGDGVPNHVELERGTDPTRWDTDGDGVNDGMDAFPLDPGRSTLPPPVPGDTTPPTITLTQPANAVLLP